MLDHHLVGAIVRGKDAGRGLDENFLLTRGHGSLSYFGFLRRFETMLLRAMPLLPEALRFAENPATSVEQLRRACELLDLDASGTQDEVRDRLRAHLNTLDTEAPVVCLNPKVS